MGEDKPGLRAVDPNEESEQPEVVPAWARARELLVEDERYLREASDGEVSASDYYAILAQLAQGWAMLALTEPRAVQFGSVSECPICHATARAVLHPDMFKDEHVGESLIPVVGCGNPWHYVFPG